MGYLSLADVARNLDIKSPDTIRKWITKGLRMKDGSGRIVALHGVPMGRKWVTTEEWLDEFCHKRLGNRFPAIETPAKGRKRKRGGKRRAQKALS